jgi:hypothetical protein
MGKLVNKVKEIDSWIMERKKGYIYTIEEHILVYLLLMIAVICSVFDITHWGQRNYSVDFLGLGTIAVLLFIRNNAKKRSIK